MAQKFGCSDFQRLRGRLAAAAAILVWLLLPAGVSAQFTPPSAATLDFIIGTSSTQTITGLFCGGGESWILTTPPLAAGLSLVDTATSSPDITGIPAGPAGSMVETIFHSCAAPAFLLPVSYTVRVSAVLTLAPAPGPLQAWTIGQPGYSQMLTRTGGAAPFTFTISAGSLPTGLIMNAGTGEITGTPTALGVFNFSVMVTDSAGGLPEGPQSVTNAYSITINAVPTITTTSPLTPTTVGATVNLPFTRTGGTAPFAWTNGAGIPPGLSVSAGGVLMGMPNTPGMYMFNVTVTDAALAADTDPFAITVNVAPTITTASPLPGGTEGVPYNQPLAATGGTSPFSNWLVSGGALPAGVTLDGPTGTLMGSPTAFGVFNFQATVQDSAGVTSAPKAFQLTILQGVSIVTPSLPNTTVGVPYSSTLTATGGTAPYSWSLTVGTLPAGLMLNNASGQVSGMATTPGVSNFTVQVQESMGSTATMAYAITVASAPMITSSLSLPSSTQGLMYPAVVLAATGGSAPLNWAVSGGALPLGMSLSAGGTISGTPTQSGNFSIDITVTDNNGAADTETFTLQIIAAPMITSPTQLPDATQNSPYFQLLQATGGTMPYSWMVTAGALPAGITLNGPSGLLSGTPTVNGVFAFTIEVTDANTAAAAKTFVMLVKSLGPQFTAGPVVTSITETSALVSWITDIDSDSQVLFGTDVVALAMATPVQDGNPRVMLHNVFLLGLLPNTNYFIRAKSTGADAVPNISPIVAFTTLFGDRPVISNIQPTQITTNSAVINWQTDLFADAEVLCGSSPGTLVSCGTDAGPNQTHSVPIGGLTPNSTVYFRVVSEAFQFPGEIAASSIMSFQTLPEQGPVISNIQVSFLTETSAVINWETNQFADSLVRFGTSPGVLGTISSNAALVKAHSQALVGLSPGTQYYYQIESANSDGFDTESLILSFTTPDDTPPMFTVGPSSGLITQTTAQVSFMTDEFTTAQVQYGTDPGNLGTAVPSLALATSHSIPLAGLTANTVYYYVAKITDTSGNIVTSPILFFQTLNVVVPAITVAPTATSNTGTSVIITWTTDIPADSLVRYGTNPMSLGLVVSNPAHVLNHAVPLANLTPNTTYYFVVESNGSGTIISPILFFVTTDMTGPVISGVSAVNITQTSAQIIWTTDELSDGVVLLSTDPGTLAVTASVPALVTGHVVLVSGLLPGTTYFYQARSTDADANTSNSSIFSFVTLPDDAPVLSMIQVNLITTTTAVVNWQTNELADSTVFFGTSPGSLINIASDGTDVSLHSLPLTGLTPGTQIYFRVQSTDTTGNTTQSGILAFTTLADDPPLISNVLATLITQTSAVINWQTDELADSTVFYGTNPAALVMSTTDATDVTSHSLAVGGLAPGTQYFFRAVSTDTTGNTSSSPILSFTTLPDTPPALSNIQVTLITQTSAVVNWVTDEEADSTVFYGTDPGSLIMSATDGTDVINHSIPLSGLTPGTTIFYRVRSTDTTGNTTTSIILSFTTLPDTAPTISNIQVTLITQTSAVINWDTDEPATSIVFYGTSPGTLGMSAIDGTLLAAHSIPLTGLTPGTQIYYRVRSVDSTGNITTSIIQSFLTLPDTPPAISNVVVTDISQTSAIVRWETDEPANSLVRYGTTPGVLGTIVSGASNVQMHQVLLTGLTPGTRYFLRVESADTSLPPNTSISGVFDFRTAPDEAPVISNVNVTAITQTTAQVNWQTNEAADSVVMFGTDPGSLLTSTSGAVGVLMHSVLLTGLMPGTTYYYRVQSSDGSLPPNTSNSGVFNFTTTPDEAPVISNVLATAITQSSAIITWQTNEPANSTVFYGLTSGALGMSTSGVGGVMMHQVLLSGLTPGTTHFFRVESADSSLPPNTSTSGVFSFTTLADTPPVISNILVTFITETTAVVNWDTNEPANSVVAWGTDPGALGTMVTNGIFKQSHSLALTGLPPGSTIFYRVSSTDTTANTTNSLILSFQTREDTPPVITAVTASGITKTAALITWLTDEFANSVVNYGTAPGALSMQVSNSNPVTAHSVPLAGLTPSTTYFYSVSSTDSTGNTSSSSIFSFTTATDPPPVISGVSATAITETTAQINWITDVPANSVVFYGVDPGALSQQVSNESNVLLHSVPLSNLIGETLYFYYVQSTGLSGTQTSPIFSFTTTDGTGPLITDLQVTDITETTAIVTWTTDEPANSVVFLGTDPATLVIDSSLGTLVTQHLVLLTGLSPATTYFVRARSTDDMANTSNSAIISFNTPDSSPPVISAVSATMITANSAQINWITNEPADSRVFFGTNSGALNMTVSSGALTTTHAIPLSGLTSGTTYFFRVESMDDDGNNTESTIFQFTTTIDAAPTISAVSVTSITQSSAIVNWLTNEPADSEVFFGTNSGTLNMPVMNPSPVTSHAIPLSGLTPGTTYFFIVQSSDNSVPPNTSTSTIFSFTTLPDLPPVISAVSASNITQTTALLNWLTNELSTSRAFYGTNPGTLNQVVQSDAGTTVHSLPLANLTPGTTYYFRVESSDFSLPPNTSTSPIFSFVTQTDNAPMITGVTVDSITNSTAVVSWITDEPATSVVFFGVNSGNLGQTVQNNALVTLHSTPLSNLTPSTTYFFRVESADGSTPPNNSTSQIFSFTTTDGAGPVISNLRALSITETTAIIAWDTDEAADSRVLIGKDPTLLAEAAFDSVRVLSHSVPVANLMPGTTYYYRVRSADASNNSSSSAIQTFDTPDNTLPVISGVIVEQITQSSAVVRWQTNKPTTSVVKFGVNAGNLAMMVDNPPLVTNHTIPLSGLTPGTTYFFRVESTDSAANVAVSGIQSFTTIADAAPIISALNITNITPTTATVNWNTDEPATSVLFYGTDAGSLSLMIENLAMVTTHSIPLSGLSPGTTYFVRVESADGSMPPNRTVSTIRTFTTIDNRGVEISQVLATQITESSAIITWMTDRMASSQVLYGTNPTLINQQTPEQNVQTRVTAHSVALSGLTRGVTYYFQARSRDTAGNISTSVLFQFRTVDSTGPVISMVRAGNITLTTATISWVTDEPANSQVEFGIDTTYGNSTAVDPSNVTEHSNVISSLTPGTLYHYRVISIDVDNNRSVSRDNTFTTVNARPTITSLSPSFALAGGEQFILAVVGTGFINGSTVRWNDMPLPTNFIGPTGLTATIAAPLIANRGVAVVTVVSPGDGGGTSNPVDFAIRQLVITSACPLTRATVGQPYLVELQMEGGAAPLSWRVSGTLPPGLTVDEFTGRVTGTPTDFGTYEFSLLVRDSRNLSDTKACSIVVVPPNLTAGIRVFGLAGSVTAASQPSFQVVLNELYPLAITGTVTLQFRPNANVVNPPMALDPQPGDDPNTPLEPSVRFSSGSRQAEFRIPRNSSRGLFIGDLDFISFQTGTIAGTFTGVVNNLTVRSARGDTATLEGNVTAAQQTTLPVGPPRISAVAIEKVTPGGFEVVVQGLSVTRQITKVSFRFIGIDAETILDPAVVELPDALTLFDAWFKNPLSTEVGSQFVLRTPFAVGGNLNLLRGIAVTVSNQLGNSVEVRQDF